MYSDFCREFSVTPRKPQYINMSWKELRDHVYAVRDYLGLMGYDTSEFNISTDLGYTKRIRINMGLYGEFSDFDTILPDLEVNFPELYFIT